MNESQPDPPSQKNLSRRDALKRIARNLAAVSAAPLIPTVASFAADAPETAPPIRYASVGTSEKYVNYADYASRYSSQYASYSSYGGYSSHGGYFSYHSYFGNGPGYVSYSSFGYSSIPPKYYSFYGSTAYYSIAYFSTYRY